MKSVLISIRPEWCAKIASGEKTVEVRKTRPKMNPPFKCYIYCTKLRQTKFGLAPGPINRPPQSWRYVEEELWND